MAANYNNAAWFYDSLSRVVYGKALVQAQSYLLPYIPPQASVLIVGGGTGWILEQIALVHPSGLQITYVEIAPNMIELSRKRNVGNNQITFITDAVENVTTLSGFDVILTPFLFDNFKPSTLTTVFEHLHSMLKPKGLWFNTDFQLTGKWWQNVLLKSMLLFFRILCGVESTRLPDVEQHFTRHAYTTLTAKTFFGDFILSTAYQKP